MRGQKFCHEVPHFLNPTLLFQPWIGIPGSKEKRECKFTAQQCRVQHSALDSFWDHNDDRGRDWQKTWVSSSVASSECSTQERTKNFVGFSQH